ncbi:hypothetical protein PPL_01710 [Heterostelium album PN500]|uniref:Uncharacterized protein n=1 Tax=Heterostelium pallidum (strain ATCC 26659 / Pp 5 / PN500) TaxID=670386 RepID=D3B094_HETP5|nr:hypothetical protein PPL_01710 [Heterostelium album PN500]EFA84718.1 hypothetical protein PPL_01710 [Heterostelium album PN500]|eukprot:XP_020436830.1 hypothetical protein PPL_01710 [Heterostelium album PN500]
MATKHTEAGLKLRGIGNSHLDIKEKLKQRCYEKLKETRKNMINEERMKCSNNSYSNSNVSSGTVSLNNNNNSNNSSNNKQSPPTSPLKAKIDVRSTILKEYEMMKLEFDQPMTSSTTTTTTTTTSSSNTTTPSTNATTSKTSTISTPIKPIPLLTRSKSPAKLLPLFKMTKLEEDLMLKEVEEYLESIELQMIKEYEDMLKLEQDELQYYSTIANQDHDDFDLQF